MLCAERRLMAMLAVLALAGCGGTGIVPAPSSAGTVRPPAAAVGPRELVGVDAKALFARFGTPRLDIRERTVRKLQFGNGRCVLDAYLYVPAKGKEPVVTHVDSRLPTGEDTDAERCAAMLGKP